MNDRSHKWSGTVYYLLLGAVGNFALIRSSCGSGLKTVARGDGVERSKPLRGRRQRDSAPETKIGAKIGARSPPETPVLAGKPDKFKSGETTVELSAKHSLLLLLSAKLPLSVRDENGRPYGLADLTRAKELIESGRAVGVGVAKRLQSLRLVYVVDRKGFLGRGDGSVTVAKRTSPGVGVTYEHITRRCYAYDRRGDPRN